MTKGAGMQPRLPPMLAREVFSADRVRREHLIERRRLCAAPLIVQAAHA